MYADPEPVTGDMESAMAVELNPWVEYEFRVVASNAIGTGDPSAPSRGVRTKEAGKYSPPSKLAIHYIHYKSHCDQQRPYVLSPVVQEFIIQYTECNFKLMIYCG